MKNYGIVKSTERPEPLTVDAYSVWEANNIQAITENIGMDYQFVGFAYELIQYDKDEYIKELRKDV